ncbi:B3 domain-containing transcription factor LEC2 isoform X2 [Helianthus annuus]|uniref:B3 domain-containing transcription factor LEC2 isoform X2 n=1 Tax=Helianthus annuus TaxID=4232 RepID=UPI001652BC09|nr:B3 domain-containing transcription factor LEC2 isoform X2 [Helianthus annuus]
MKNINDFDLNATPPFSEDESEYDEIPYSYTHDSLLSQQTGPFYGEPCEIGNFRSTGPIGVHVSVHLVPTLSTIDYKEYRRQAKIARANRKQIRAEKKAKQSSSSDKPSKKAYSGCNKGSDQDNHIIYTRDNVLRILLRKMLTYTDVGFLGRILLPKKAAEQNLPALASKEGVEVILREVYSNKEWKMTYRYWANQKGNIYLFDQCADFVKENLLNEGDHLELYHDEQKNLYFTIQKKEKHGAQPSNLQ